MANFNLVVLAGTVRKSDLDKGCYVFNLVIEGSGSQLHVACRATEKITDNLMAKCGDLDGCDLLIHGSLRADYVLVTEVSVL